MGVITIYDYLLLPLYITLFYYIARIYSKKFYAEGLGKFYTTGFWLRMGGAVLYSLVVQYYYGYGDSFIYYGGGELLRTAAADNGFFSTFFLKATELSKIANSYSIGAYTEGTMAIESNLTVMRASAILSFFSFHCYMIIALFMGFYSFVGSWKLFYTFNEIMGKKTPKLLAYVVLYAPSMWFWGSGLLKESLCMGALGLLVATLYRNIVKKQFRAMDVLTLLFNFYLLFSIKSYLAGVLLAAMAVAIVANYIIARTNILSKMLATVFVTIAGVTLFSFTMSNYIDSVVEESAALIVTSKKAYAEEVDERSVGSFSAGDFDLSLQALILRTPVAVSTTLYRPFIWETRKPMMLFSAFESFIMLVMTLYLVFKLRFFRFFSVTFSNPYLIFSLVFSVLMGAMVGLTTFNFGTMVRYRLPLLPFYGFLLVYLYNYVREQGKKKTAQGVTA